MVQWEWVYCDADDFCREFLPTWERQLLEAGARQRVRSPALTVSEVMTIVIAFHLPAFEYNGRRLQSGQHNQQACCQRKGTNENSQHIIGSRWSVPRHCRLERVGGSDCVQFCQR